MIGRRDDPAFLYFPTNYRWSMGLLICLGAAPWTGIEIDEVHRVGRALDAHVGDDNAWFEEWTRMGDKIAARGRGAEASGHKRTGASGLRLSRRASRVRRQRHRRDGAEPRRLLCAARGGAGAALRLRRRLGRAVGLSRGLGEKAR